MTILIVIGIVYLISGIVVAWAFATAENLDDLDTDI